MSNEEQAVDEKVQYRVTHLDHILYVHEVGNNTCQKNLDAEVSFDEGGVPMQSRYCPVRQ